MTVGRFFGMTTREALKEVRLALGPDALIVSNRRVNGGVEILATDQTLEDLAGAADKLAAASEAQKAAAEQAAAAQAAIAQAAALQSSAQALGEGGPFDVQQAVGDLRGMLETRLDEVLWGQQLQRAPVVLSVFQRLLGMGFSTRLLRAMLKHLPAQLSERAALDWCRNELIKHLPIENDDERAFPSGAVVALVGPTGVGKTTTVAKLAARCVRRLGADNVVLVTTDTYRIGAYEQLRIYGRLMGVPVHVAEGAAQLAALVREAGPERLVLIDNIGVSQRDQYVGEQAAMLAAASPRLTRLLALNAASHGDTLDEVARRYANDGGPRLIGSLITKVDEAGRLAPVLDTCIRYRLPVHYVSTGQKVPEDLMRPDADQLMDRALSVLDGPALYAPSQADLAMLMAAQEAAAPKAAVSPPVVSVDNLLALLAGGASGLCADDIEAASRAIDEHLVTAVAYEAFQQWQSGQAPAAPAQLLSQVERTLSLLNASHAVVLADQLRLPGKQALHAGLLAAPDGQWLASPWQCWVREDGWVASDDQAGTQPLGVAQLDAMLDATLDEAGLPRISVLDELAVPHVSQARWIAPCVPRSSWLYAGLPTAASSISRQLLHQPLPMEMGRFACESLGWREPDDVTWWAAQTSVARAERAQDAGQELSFFSLKAQRRDDGAVRKQWMAVGSLPDRALNPAYWGQWLLLQSECQAVFKLAELHWQWLAQRRLPSVQQAGVAMQLALATAHMLDDLELSRVLYALADEAEGKPSMAQLARASCKLFEFKRMLPV